MIATQQLYARQSKLRYTAHGSTRFFRQDQEAAENDFSALPDVSESFDRVLAHGQIHPVEQDLNVVDRDVLSEKAFLLAVDLHSRDLFMVMGTSFSWT